MSHPYVSNRMHCIFSKEQRKLIYQDLEALME
jgi:hypothetical protein